MKKKKQLKIDKLCLCLTITIKNFWFFFNIPPVNHELNFKKRGGEYNQNHPLQFNLSSMMMKIILYIFRFIIDFFRNNYIMINRGRISLFFKYFEGIISKYFGEINIRCGNIVDFKMEMDSIKIGLLTHKNNFKIMGPNYKKNIIGNRYFNTLNNPSLASCDNDKNRNELNVNDWSDSKISNNIKNNVLSSSVSSDTVFKKYFKNNTIINILNKYNIDEKIIDEIENEITVIGLIFATVKDDLTIDHIKNLKKEIYERFESFGIKLSVISKMFNEFERSIAKEENDEEMLELDIFIERINEIVKKKNVLLSNKVLNRLQRILKISNNIIEFAKDFVTKDFKKEIDKFKECIIKELLESSKLVNKVKGRKNRLKAMNASDYKGEFSIVIDINVHKIKTEVIKWLMSKDKELLSKLLSDMNKMREVLFDDYKENVEGILLESYPLNYNIRSMKSVVNKKESESLYFLHKFNAENIRKIDELNRTIKSWGDEKLLINKIEKYNINEPLMKLIRTIINNSMLGNREKQIGIEKLCLEYDLNWFKNEMQNSLDIRSVILHDIYNKLNNSINFIILPYTKNDWSSLYKLYNKVNLKGWSVDSNINKKDEIKIKSLLIYLLLGNDKIISISFKVLIELFTSENMEKKRTELVFSLGNKLIKFAQYNLMIIKKKIMI